MIRLLERVVVYGELKGWYFNDITDRGYEDIKLIQGLDYYNFIKFKYGGKYHKIRLYTNKFGTYFSFGKTIYVEW